LAASSRESATASGCAATVCTTASPDAAGLVEAAEAGTEDLLHPDSPDPQTASATSNQTKESFFFFMASLHDFRAGDKTHLMDRRQ
jgi:hypothetical protein